MSNDTFRCGCDMFDITFAHTFTRALSNTFDSLLQAIHHIKVTEFFKLKTEISLSERDGERENASLGRSRWVWFFFVWARENVSKYLSPTSMVVVADVKGFSRSEINWHTHTHTNYRCCCCLNVRRFHWHVQMGYRQIAYAYTFNPSSIE